MNLQSPVNSAYIERVNLAIDHVVRHIGEPLRLADAARAARMSPFHFHRVFRALVGETPADFVKRLRLERALVLMAHAPRSSLTTIAMKCGFSTSSDFSRCFKQRYGKPPSLFAIKAWRDAHAAELQATVPDLACRLHLDRLPATHNPEGFSVGIRELPARTVAYIRVLRRDRGYAVV
jgi:AraC family transcriptional regulator